MLRPATVLASLVLAAATAGCTTMAEGNLKNLIATVDPAKRPVYILLPEAEY